MSDEFQLETETFSIVAVGAFNPSIFQPYWFSENQLIRSEEAKAADIALIQPHAAIFTAEWFSLQVTNLNFTILTKDSTKANFLRDLVFGTFKLLEHTPLTAFGFNTSTEYKATSEEAWHEFGHHFAPKPSWRGVLKQPGLLNMTMQGQREGSPSRIQLRIDASPQIPLGIIISVNEHYNFQKGDGEIVDLNNSQKNKAFLSALGDDWGPFLQYSRKARKHLFEASVASPKSTKKRKS